MAEDNKDIIGRPFTTETAKAASKKSRESARRNKSLREWAKFYGKQQISVKLPDEENKTQVTWDGAVIISLYKRAMTKGDTQAAKLLAELSGQAPEQNVNITANIATRKSLSVQEARDLLDNIEKEI